MINDRLEAEHIDYAVTHGIHLYNIGWYMDTVRIESKTAGGNVLISTINRHNIIKHKLIIRNIRDENDIN